MSDRVAMGALWRILVHVTSTSTGVNNLHSLNLEPAPSTPTIHVDNSSFSLFSPFFLHRGTVFSLLFGRYITSHWTLVPTSVSPLHVVVIISMLDLFD